MLGGIIALALAGCGLAAQDPVLASRHPKGVELPQGRKAPDLRPGEALALAGPDGEVQSWGEAAAEQPLGALAALVWLRFEGDAWAARDVRFKCPGGPGACTRPKGHGRVDLAEALRLDCRLALRAWIAESAALWVEDYGQGVARARLEDAFRPFLGGRLPRGETLPAFSPAWTGEGDLLRTRPSEFMAWMADPAQYELLSRCRRTLGSAGFHFRDLVGSEDWWTLAGVDPGGAWVAGGNGRVAALLRMPGARTAEDGRARFKALLGIKG
jgi:hypothetical protein